MPRDDEQLELALEADDGLEFGEWIKANSYQPTERKEPDDGASDDRDGTPESP